MDYTFVEDDTGSVLQITFRDRRGDTLDISGAVATLYWTNPVTGIQTSRTMTHVDSVAGIAKYQFAASEIKPPYMVFDAIITDVGGKTLSTVGPLREPVRTKFVVD